MADAEHAKLDDGTILNLADAAARQKIGSAELQTTAKDCSGAINELKQSLDDKGTWVELLGSTSTVGNHTLVDSYRNYKSIMIVLFMSGSKIISQVCPSNFLLSAGYKMYVQSGSDACLVSFSDNTTINIESTTQSIRIYGQK